MTRRPSLPADAPCLDPRNGLRQRKRADGSWRVWWEPTGAEGAAGALAVDLSDMKPGDAQRRADQLKAKAQGKAGTTPAPRQGTVDSVIADYMASRFWSGLQASTQRSYGADLRAVSAKWGPLVARAITAPEVDRWYDATLAEKGKFRARALHRMLSIVMAHAKRRGLADANPCADIKTFAPAGRQRRGTVQELIALVAAARALRLRSVRAALMLVIFGGGQRQADVLKAMPGDFSRPALQLVGMAAPRRFLVWELTRNKRGNAGALVINPAAAPVLRLQLRLAAARGLPLIFDDATGAAYSPRLFWKRWEAVRALAAKTEPTVATLQWRDLRRTFSNLARAGGASIDDVGDAIGNSAAQDEGLRQVYMAAQLETTARATLAVAPLQSARKAG
jgi:hypothetical protein